MARKAKKAQPLVFDERYEFVEKRLLPLAHVRPTIIRFIQLTEVLELGFEEALKEPLDERVGEQPWLAACLALLTESPISAPEHAWKFSLTVQDVRAIEETMRNPLWVIAKWHRAVCNANPMNRPDYVGGLLEAVDKSLILPFVRYHEEKGGSCLDFPPHPYSTFDGNGNVVYDNAIVLGMLRGCTVKNAVPRYAAEPVRDQDEFELLELFCQGEYDHLAACQTAATHIQNAIHYLAEREKKFDSLIDSPARYHVLTLPITQEPIFTFLSHEFDEPLALHLAHVDDPKLTAALNEEIDFVVSRVQYSVELVLKAAKGTDAASKLDSAWAALIGRFERRSLQGAVPPYIEQEQFHWALFEFRKLYNAAIEAIAKPMDMSALTGGKSIKEIGRTALEQELPAAAKLYAQMHPESVPAADNFDAIAEAVHKRLEPMFARACTSVVDLAQGVAKSSSATPAAKAANAALEQAANTLQARYEGVGLEKVRDEGKRTQIRAVIDYTWDDTPVAFNREALDDVRQPRSMNKIVEIVWAANRNRAWAEIKDGYASEGALFQQCNRMLKRTGNPRNPFNTVKADA